MSTSQRFKIVALTLALVGFSGRGAWALVDPLPDWMQRFHLGGNAAIRTMVGQDRAQLERNGGIMVYQAGLVFDVDVAQDVSFWYDTNLVREGIARSASEYPLEQLYVRWDNILKQSWLNAKLGRVFTPFGEEYLKWNSISNPLTSFSTSLPWAQDEGTLLFGDILPNQKLSYAFAVQNGNEKFNFSDPSKMVAGRISGKPLPWMYLSSSFLSLGHRGTTDDNDGSWWLSGFHIEPLGPTTAASGASTGTTVDGQAFEEDMILKADTMGQLWMRYGYVRVQDGGGSEFNRILRYYSGELTAYLPKTHEKAYLVGRYSAIGTFSPTLGYRFAGTELVEDNFHNNANPYEGLDYNQRDLYRWSLGAGYYFTTNILLKMEYSWEDTHLIESAKTPENLALLGLHNFFTAEVAVRF